ncbi:MAG: hypothetical protein R2710_21855 [Acidimicrobiales bacterium]
MAIIDMPGFVAEMKEHAADHGFHVHDERHFVETYSLRQVWEVDLHPERACGGPLDLHLAVELDPRTMLSFEDKMIEENEPEDPPRGYLFPLIFNWALPRFRRAPICCCSPPSWQASVDPTFRSRSRPSTPPCRSPTHRSARSRSPPRSTSTWPTSTCARKTCATCSIVASPSASGCSTAPHLARRDLSGYRVAARPSEFSVRRSH